MFIILEIILNKHVLVKIFNVSFMLLLCFGYPKACCNCWFCHSEQINNYIPMR